MKLTLLIPNNNSLTCELSPENSLTLESLIELILSESETDPLLLRYFYWLFKEPELTVCRRLVFYWNGERVQKPQALSLRDENLLEIKLNAYIQVAELPSIQKRNIADYQACRPVIDYLLTELFHFDNFPIRKIKSFDELKNQFPTFNESEKLKTLYRFARIVYEAPFENYSKVLLGMNFMTPLMMWRNIYQNHGGVCSEKVSAYKFICDVLGVESRSVFGGLKHELDTEEYLLKYHKSAGRQKLPFWLNHHLLEVSLDGRNILVDVTNGNLPFLFLDEADASLRYKNGIKCRMVYERKRLTLHKSTSLAGDLLQNISEYSSDLLPFGYVFKQQLGLLITDQCYIGLYAGWHPKRSRMMQQYYSNLARRNGFPFPAFFHKDNLSSLEDENLREMIQSSLMTVRENYPLQEFSGDFTVVIQKLISREKRYVSSSLYEALSCRDQIVGEAV